MSGNRTFPSVPRYHVTAQARFPRPYIANGATPQAITDQPRAEITFPLLTGALIRQFSLPPAKYPTALPHPGNDPPWPAS